MVAIFSIEYDICMYRVTSKIYELLLNLVFTRQTHVVKWEFRFSSYSRAIPWYAQHDTLYMLYVKKNELCVDLDERRPRKVSKITLFCWNMIKFPAIWAMEIFIYNKEDANVTKASA